MEFLKKLFKTKSNGISSDEVLVLNSIASSISSKTDLEICTKQLLKYIKKNPDNVFLHQLIATAYFKNGDNDTADLHLDKAITLGIKDGGYSLLIKAYSNMFDGYCSYDAVDSLRTLLNDESRYIDNTTGEIQVGIFEKINDFGFPSHYIDMRSGDMKAEILYSLAVTFYDFDEKQEAIAYLEEAIILQPESAVFNQKHIELTTELKLNV
ncbi:MAG: tetratricopeptide (TPR) repeat protein [Flavobacteriales bacterium]|jgi:tetratricopeptide (TPR) repeat protein